MSTAQPTDFTPTADQGGGRRRANLSARTTLIGCGIVVLSAIPINRAAGITALHPVLVLVILGNLGRVAKLSGCALFTVAVAVVTAVYLSVRDYSLGGSLHPTALGFQYLSISILIVGILLLSDRGLPVVTAVLYLFAGSALSYVLFPTPASSSNIIKFGIGPQVAAIVLYNVARRLHRRWYLLSCAALSIVFTASAFRSMAGIAIVSAVVTAWKMRQVETSNSDPFHNAGGHRRSSF